MNNPDVVTITLNFNIKNDRTKIDTILDIYNNKDNQQKISTNNDDTEIYIWVRDGTAQIKDENIKKELEKLGFKYYIKTRGHNDPHYTLRCTPEHWNTIKDNPVFENLNVWNSGDGERQ